jgi:PAS domain S-box-containing protein
MSARESPLPQTDRVLVVDDEPKILQSLEDLLEDDFSVVTVLDPEVGLRLLQELEVAVILSDQRMPRLPGDVFLKKAREVSAASRILITGYADLAAVMRAVNEGHIYGYVSKPWNPLELKALVSRAAAYFHLLESVDQERGLMQALMGNLPDAIYFKNDELHYTRLNRAQARLLGLDDPSRAVGKSEADFLDRELAERLREEDRGVLETGTAVIDRIQRIAVAGSQARWLSTTKSPIHNPGGRVTGVVAVSRDITDRKNLEAQLLQAQKMEAVGQLAGGIAHDFNNLLGVISGYTDLLEETLIAHPAALRHAEQIRKATDQAAALTGQLLAFSRRQVLQPSVLDLNAVVSDVEQMLRRVIGEHIQLTTILEQGLGRVLADPAQLQQALINLAVNARDAMLGGGRLTLETSTVVLDEDFTLTHPDLQPGRHVRLTVTDTGHGMNPEIQARAFEPFFTTKSERQGTGLGLAMVFGVVKQSGGHVTLESEPGRGSTFRIYLPEVTGELSPAPLPEPAGLPAVGTETILLVEDAEALRVMIRRMLESAGYGVLLAADPEEALRVLASHDGPIDLVLTDVIMPRMSGPELVDKLREDHSTLKVLYMSGYTDEAIGHRGVLEAGTYFIQKPFGLRGLLLKLREILDAPTGGR